MASSSRRQAKPKWIFAPGALRRLSREDSGKLAFTGAAILILMVSAVSSTAMTSVVEKDLEGRRDQVLVDVASVVQTELTEQARSLARLALVWSMQTAEGEPIESTKPLPTLTRDNAPDLGVAAALTNVLMDTYIQTMFPRNISGIRIGVANVTIGMSIADVLVEDVTLDTKGIDWERDLDAIREAEKGIEAKLRQNANDFGKLVDQSCARILARPPAGTVETAAQAQCVTYKHVAETALWNALETARFDAAAAITEVPGFEGPGIIAPRPGKNFYRVVGTADVVVREEFGPHATSTEAKIDTIVLDPTPFLLAKSQSFETVASGEDSEVGRLVTYILTTQAQWRVLNGYGITFTKGTMEEQNAPKDTNALEAALGRLGGAVPRDVLERLATYVSTDRSASKIITENDVRLATRIALDLAAARHFRTFPENADPTARAIMANYSKTRSLDAADVLLLLGERGSMDAATLSLDLRIYLAQALYLIMDQVVFKALRVNDCQDRAKPQTDVVLYWTVMHSCLRDAAHCQRLEGDHATCEKWQRRLAEGALLQKQAFECFYRPWGFANQPFHADTKKCVEIFGIPKYLEDRMGPLLRGALIHAWFSGQDCDNTHFGSFSSKKWTKDKRFCSYPRGEGALEYSLLSHRFGHSMPFLSANVRPNQMDLAPLDLVGSATWTLCMADGQRYNVTSTGTGRFDRRQWDPSHEISLGGIVLGASESKHNNFVPGDFHTLWEVDDKYSNSGSKHLWGNTPDGADEWGGPYAGTAGIFFDDIRDVDGNYGAEPAPWTKLHKGMLRASTEGADLTRVTSALFTKLAYDNSIYDFGSVGGWRIDVPVNATDSESALESFRREAIDRVRSLRAAHVANDGAVLRQALASPDTLAWMSTYKEKQALNHWIDEVWTDFYKGSSHWESSSSLSSKVEAPGSVPVEPIKTALRSRATFSHTYATAHESTPCTKTATAGQSRDDGAKAWEASDAQALRDKWATEISGHIHKGLPAATKEAALADFSRQLDSRLGYIRSFSSFRQDRGWDATTDPSQANVNAMFLGPIYDALQDVLADAASSHDLFDYVMLSMEQMTDGYDKMMSVRNIEYRLPLSGGDPFLFTSTRNRTGAQDFGAPPAQGQGSEPDPARAKYDPRDVATLWERTVRNEKANASLQWAMTHTFPSAFSSSAYLSATRPEDMRSGGVVYHVLPTQWSVAAPPEPAPWDANVVREPPILPTPTAARHTFRDPVTGEEHAWAALPGSTGRPTWEILEVPDRPGVDWHKTRDVWSQTLTRPAAGGLCVDGATLQRRAVEDNLTLPFQRGATGIQNSGRDIDIDHQAGLPIVLIQAPFCKTEQHVCHPFQFDCVKDRQAEGYTCTNLVCTRNGQDWKPIRVLIDPATCSFRQAADPTKPMTITDKSTLRAGVAGSYAGKAGASFADYCAQVADWSQVTYDRMTSIEEHQLTQQRIRREEYKEGAANPRHREFRAFEEWAQKNTVGAFACPGTTTDAKACSKDLVDGDFRMLDLATGYPMPTESIFDIEDLYALRAEGMATLDQGTRESGTEVAIGVRRDDGALSDLKVSLAKRTGARYATDRFAPTPYQNIVVYRVFGNTSYTLSTVSNDLLFHGKPLERHNVTKVTVEMELPITFMSAWKLDGFRYIGLDDKEFWGGNALEALAAKDGGKAGEAKKQAQRLTEHIAGLFSPIIDFIDLIMGIINSLSEIIGEILGAVQDLFMAIFGLILKAIVYVIGKIVEIIAYIICIIFDFFNITPPSIHISVFGLSLTIKLDDRNCAGDYGGGEPFGRDENGRVTQAYPIIIVDADFGSVDFTIKLYKYRSGSQPVSAFLAGTGLTGAAATVPMTLAVSGNIHTPNQDHPWRFGFDVAAVGQAFGMHAFDTTKDVHEVNGPDEPIHSDDGTVWPLPKTPRRSGEAAGFWVYHRFNAMPDARFVETRVVAVTDHGEDVVIQRVIPLPYGFEMSLYFTANNAEQIKLADQDIKAIVKILGKIEEGIAQMLYDMLICLDYAAYDATVEDTEFETDAGDCVPGPGMLADLVVSVFEEMIESIDDQALKALSRFGNFGFSLSYETPAEPAAAKPTSFLQAFKAGTKGAKADASLKDKVRAGATAAVKHEMNLTKEAKIKQAQAALGHAKSAFENAKQAFHSKDEAFRLANDTYQKAKALHDAGSGSSTLQQLKKAHETYGSAQKAMEGAKKTLELAEATKLSADAALAAAKALPDPRNRDVNEPDGGSSGSGGSSGAGKGKDGKQAKPVPKRGVRVDIVLDRPEKSLPIFINWAVTGLSGIFSGMTKGDVSGGMEDLSRLEDVVINVYAYQALPKGKSAKPTPDSLGLNLRTNLPAILQRTDATQIYSLGVKTPFTGDGPKDVGVFKKILSPVTVRNFWWLKLDAAVVYTPPNVDKLLQKFAPYLVMSPGDVLPVNATDYLAHMKGVRRPYHAQDQLRLLDTGEATYHPVDAAKNWLALVEAGTAESWIGMPDASWAPRAQTGTDPYREGKNGPVPVVYARFVRSDHFAHLQYFMLWPSSTWVRSSEGHWQMYTALIPAAEFDDAGTAAKFEALRPRWVALTGHRENAAVGMANGAEAPWIRGERWPWAQVPVSAGTHARVHVATGSHALTLRTEDIHWMPGILDQVGAPRVVYTDDKGEIADDKEYDLILRLPDRANTPVSAKDPTPKVPWLLYEGRWGEVTDPLDASRASGSRGPVFLDHGLAWEHPQTWALTLPLAAAAGGP